MRFGLGFDIHRLRQAAAPGNLVLGAVAIPGPLALEAHSDGDVLLHALVDACLGALALGDIGQLFPDTDQRHKNRSSSEFVIEAMTRVHSAGWKISQVDSNIFLEHPKLAAHMGAIRKSLSVLLGVELADVSVKAKTFEGLGPIGAGTAVAAQVLVALIRPEGR